MRVVADSIHGNISLTDQEWQVVDTRSFQRLRHIRQLGMGHVTYPNATHTRFAHCLGALGIMARILDLAEGNGIELSSRQKENLRLAALLHDIGHYPYSHVMEHVDSAVLTEELVEPDDAHAAPQSMDLSSAKYPRHETVGKMIATNQPDLIRAIGGEARATDIAALFARDEAADPQLSKLIHSSLDIDRADYLLRDSHAAGVPYGQVDINYILNSLRMSPGGVVGVSDKALPAAEQFLLARYFMHRAVYFHKTTVGIEEACRQLLRRLRDKGSDAVPQDGNAVSEIVKGNKLANFTDAYVDRAVLQATEDDDPVVAALAKAVCNRRPPKLLKEVSVLAPREQVAHAGVLFRNNCRHGIRQVAEEHGLHLGLFLLWQYAFKIEERGHHLTGEEARALEPEEREEAIKVFLDEGSEPRSLVDIDHSLMQGCGGCVLHLCRLYVVCEDTSRESMANTLRSRIRDWAQE